MGWVWNDDDSKHSGADDFSVFKDFENPRSSSGSDGDGGERCATRKVVNTRCRTEETEPGKFIRKCEKTEQIFKDCIGRPSEMVESNKEYTEEDVTDQMTNGSYSIESSVPFDFPGLRSDIENIERSFFGGLDRFFEAAEEMKNGFFGAFSIPRVFDDDLSSPRERRGIPIESHPPKEGSPKSNKSDGEVDLSGLARDV
ncbi:fra a 1-associated protein-like isoform X2 [Nicotiana tabacum]|uniref:Fra a 1-associated protein-like isoform X2 n=1 Tax=Nicotiana tabacum TaxID=4097 RepID=A0AC58U457_TOBAC